MIDRVEAMTEALRGLVSGLDPGALSAVDAARLVELFAEGERLCAAGRTLAAGRVQRSPAWRDAGFASPARWMAARAKMTLGQAIASMETAGRLDRLPELRETFARGHLSETQAVEIAAAAAADPAAEPSLVDAAGHETVDALRERCRAVRVAARSDESAAERIRRGRFLRSWTDRDGAVRLDGRFAPDDGARLLARVKAEAERLQAEARRSRQREGADAYAADALVGLATGGAVSQAVVQVEVDAAAYERGRVLPGERSVIRGVGPVPVEVVRRLARDGVVKLLERDGVEVTRVAHLGRAIPAHLRSALEARDPTCVVPGCDVRNGLEIDHILPYARGGHTSLANLARLCRYHHAQKTHRGWRLEGHPGHWRWLRGGAPDKTPSRERAP